MPDGSVAILPAADADPASTVAERLAGLPGIRESEMTNLPPGDWFLFETEAGPGAFRPLSPSDGENVPVSAAEGLAATDAMKSVEPLLAAVEAALGLSIAPLGIGGPPDGTVSKIEDVREATRAALALVLPKADGSLSDDAKGLATLAVSLEAPAFPEGEQPAEGDILVLGAPVRGTAEGSEGDAFDVIVSLPELAGQPLTAERQSGVVAFSAACPADSMRAVRDGAPLTLSNEALPAVLTIREDEWAGVLVPFGSVLAFKFD